MKKKKVIEFKNIHKSVVITLWFYQITLLAHSIYTVITTGELGITFIILNAGLLLFWFTQFGGKNKKAE